MTQKSGDTGNSPLWKEFRDTKTELVNPHMRWKTWTYSTVPPVGLIIQSSSLCCVCMCARVCAWRMTSSAGMWFVKAVEPTPTGKLGSLYSRINVYDDSKRSNSVLTLCLCPAEQGQTDFGEYTLLFWLLLIQVCLWVVKRVKSVTCGDLMHK